VPKALQKWLGREVIEPVGTVASGG
jgi:hypothetical protein